MMHVPSAFSSGLRLDFVSPGVPRRQGGRACPVVDPGARAAPSVALTWLTLGRSSEMMSVSGRIMLAVFVDMLAVALVVPNLVFYMRDLGLTSSGRLLGVVWAAYPLAQVVGGVTIGYLSDMLPRRDVLVVSMCGAAMSYALVAASLSFGSGVLFVMSRVVVGLVKQTMTISTAMLLDGQSAPSASTDKATVIARLQAMVGLAFIVGPLLGGYLSVWGGSMAPPLLASALFIVDIAFVIRFIPRRRAGRVSLRGKTRGNVKVEQNDEKSKPAAEESGRGAGGIRASLKSLFANEWLGVYLAYRFTSAATRSLGTTYEVDRFSMTPPQLGMLRSSNRVTALIAQWFLIPLSARVLGSAVSFKAGVAALSLLSFIEAHHAVGLQFYFALQVPVALATQLAVVSAKAAAIQSVPQNKLGTSLALQDAMLSAAGVLGPFYGGILVDVVGSLEKPRVAAAHYAVLAAVALLAMGRVAQRRGSQASAGAKILWESMVDGDGNTERDTVAGTKSTQAADAVLRRRGRSRDSAT